MLKLDFNIQSSTDRADFVSAFFSENPDYKPTQSELDTLSNYILYGKDADGTSVVDRGEVEIETKYKSYSKRKAESLDELMEAPGFNENTVVTQYVYRHPKPTIDREVDKVVPGMEELWAAIDRTAYILDLAAGKIEVDPAQPPVDLSAYSQTDLYKLKHHLIDMRKQQYVLKEAYGGTEHTFNPNVKKGAQIAPRDSDSVDWDHIWFYPLGLWGCPHDSRWDSPQDYQATVTPWDRNQQVERLIEKDYVVIDFTNSEHVYELAKNLESLMVEADNESDGTSAAIVDTLKFYAARANLSDCRQHIWDLKCRQFNNASIRKEVNSMFGTSYNENYISTLFKQNICTDIAAAAQLHYDYFLNRDDQQAWKVCTGCGKKKLRDPREFMRKAKSSDGLASRCKECEKLARQQRSQQNKI